MSPRNNSIFFILILIASMWFSAPSLLNLDKSPKINLGLDLQGGLYVLLEVDKKNIFENKMKNIASQIKYISEKNDYFIDEMKINENQLYFTILDDDKKTQETLKKYFSEEHLIYKHSFIYEKEEGAYTVSIEDKYKNKILKEKIDKTLEVIRNRLNQFGLSEPSVVKNGTDRIEVEVAGVNTLEEERRILKLITTTAYLQFMKVSKNKKNIVKYPDIKNPKILYPLNNVAILDGEYLENAKVGFDKNNKIQIVFELTNEGGHIFRRYTTNNIGTQLAIVIDQKVYSAPTIQSSIGKNGSISGNFTMEEAKDLAIALKSGSSGVKLNVLEKKTIGASLGEESIKHGAISLIIGFLIVLIFIVWYYKFGGLIASFALITNLFLIIMFMAFMHATMTLPGIIGIVLTVGMAIDSNILINERIKDELKLGKTNIKAIEAGYDKAVLTIMDSNITTLISAMILYAYGNSTIKGFALTLSAGILASMFTAIYGTKNLYLWIKPKKLFGVIKGQKNV